MPQMKPMIWLLMMILTLTMTMMTIIMNFFTTMEMPNQFNKKTKVIKWKW
uniref:ATP synthase F0 subunit 8 n=1 Tax=Andrena chrysosceles TaxID=1411665 RepID=A0A0S2LUG6_9HYME|nr:ATP synthase F0 subunit 8 [Andrena chrysosceles]